MPAVSLHHVSKADRFRLEAIYGDYRAELGASSAHMDRYFPLYWVEDERTPLWLCHNGTEVGFALVRALAPASYELAEFCIKPGHRRKGLGCDAAKAVFRAFPGEWRLSVLKNNQAGQAFWRNVFARGPDDTGQPSCYHFESKESDFDARPVV